MASDVDTRLAREAVSVLALFTGLTLCLTHPVAFHLSDALPGDLGDPLLNAWILGWDAERILEGLRGLWDAPIFYPYENTLAYSEHLLGIAIFVAPIHWLTGNPIVAYNVAFLSSYVLAGTGMYLLARTLTGSWMAAMVAGAAFAFGPNRVDQISHLQMLMWGWMPFSVWALHRYFAFGSRRALALFALTFLILGLSNGYFLYYFGLPVGVLIAAEVVHRRRYWKRHALDLGAAAAGMLIVLWPIISAYLDSRLNQGLVRNRDVMRMYSADVTSYLQVPSSIDLWAGILRTGPEGTALFPGLVVIVLAIVGLAARGRYAAWPGRGTDLSTGRQVALYGGIGALMFCLSLGPEPQWGGRTLLASGPYDWLLLVVPGLDGLRVPARMAPVVYLSLAALAAIGVSAICRWLPRRATVAVSLLLVAGICLEGYPGPTRVARFVTQERPNDVAAYEWLALGTTRRDDRASVRGARASEHHARVHACHAST